MTGTTDIGTTFSWSGPNSFSSTQQNPTIASLTAAGNGTYTFVATSAAGCPSLPATVSVTGNAQPVIASVTATPATICSGTNSQLNALATVPGLMVVGSSGATFTDISSTGTSVGTVSDDSEHNITFPAFGFNGVSYTTGRVGMNGVFMLGVTTGDVALTNAALPSTTNGSNVFLAPWWDDLDIQGGASILTQTVGNLYIVQWNNVAHNAVTAGTNNITFQVQLDLATGAIYFVYNDVLWGDVNLRCGRQRHRWYPVELNERSAVQFQYGKFDQRAGHSPIRPPL
ncbi:MAG: hypothetical protein V9F04_05255 [Dermatophilaceae bacterium]